MAINIGIQPDSMQLCNNIYINLLLLLLSLFVSILSYSAGLTDEQLNYLHHIEIGKLMSTTKLFCTLIEDGFTDFCGISLKFKAPLSEDTIATFCTLTSQPKYKGEIYHNFNSLSFV